MIRPSKTTTLRCARLALAVAAGLSAACRGPAVSSRAPGLSRHSDFTTPSHGVPRAIREPAGDADPEDPAWRDVPGIVLRAAAGSKPLLHPTEVRVLWTPEALFVRFECGDDTLQLPFTGVRDAKLFKGDVVEVFLDAEGEGRRWMEFQISPLGDIADLLIELTSPPVSGPDGMLLPEVYPSEYRKSWGWNAESVRVAARILERDGRRDWIVDLALPAEVVLNAETGARLGPGPLRAHFVRYNRMEGESRPRHATWNPAMPAWNPHRVPLLMGRLDLRPE